MPNSQRWSLASQLICLLGASLLPLACGGEPAVSASGVTFTRPDTTDASSMQPDSQTESGGRLGGTSTGGGSSGTSTGGSSTGGTSTGTTTGAPLFVLNPSQVDGNPQAPAPLSLVSTQAPKDCADVPNAAPAANVQPGLYYCNGVAGAQAWRWGGGNLVTSGLYCLDTTPGDGTAPGAHPALEPCSAGSLAWNFVGGHVQVAGTQTCLSRTSANVATSLALIACNPNDPTQGWALSANDGNKVTGIALQNVGATACLEAQMTGSAHVGPCNAKVAQQWVWEGSALRSGGKCLGVSPMDATVPQLVDCGLKPNQSWQLLGSTVVNTATGMCLGTSGTVGSDGTTPLQLQACSGAASQAWAL